MAGIKGNQQSLNVLILTLRAKLGPLMAEGMALSLPAEQTPAADPGWWLHGIVQTRTPEHIQATAESEFARPPVL